jgi:hypothetical protein
MLTIESMEEVELDNKQNICDLLLPALQATRQLYDLVSLEYHPERDGYVVARFKNGSSKFVNVACDSGIAMVRDICREIGR